ncbi:putative NRPS-related enzyme [Actinoplanes missouriensis 431]|uniref:Putative NRPS-related enzyme n=1 Tax=Actinoplanes missouriensis (strain ATCC 14538 / DSM 43046 / CBS 188.64 / JCM 3121 / NBRC 102363 / NCIMB 12654 / NRRL B-3342 / UNCC 431) TaxID=512565 RepID=I0H625_ACTM4|nr:amino acid adenylation domain-containing protein [Actinoplanes missouriensis]BAL88462.1 putative NRPS-related enzyme [Actinoplanes missouriensis 431]
MFDRRARLTPDAEALRFRGAATTYGELSRAANTLARELVRRGVGPERIVGLQLPRGPEMIIAMLAVVRAGGAFLPIDAAYPPDRIAFMRADAAPVLIVTEDRDEHEDQDGTGAVVSLHALRAAASDLPDGDLSDADRLAPLDPAHPAYVIYTSGSTGRPKGVVVTHTGLYDLTTAQATAFGVGTASRVLQFASPSFDAAVSEICMALLTGATLVLAPQSDLAPGPALSALITRERVTHATLPPAVLPLQELPDSALPAGLSLIVAGEFCPSDTIRRWAPGRTMINAYGPTESTVCATMTAPLRAGDLSHIGTAISGTRLHIAGDDLAPVPPGGMGEMFIAGAGLARGYLNRPALTAQRFLPDPWGPPGSRMYRTGDLAHWCPDGTVGYDGRADDQIKIRGFRVEPAEIEAVLRERPDITEARVLLIQGRLAAYLVPGPDGHADTRAAAAHLAARLPAHMVPGAYTVIDDLPLTPSGKVDKERLPAPVFTASAGTPRTPQEEILCRLFADVLGLPRVGAEDNFFELGGDSLMATRLSVRIRSELGIDIPVVAIIEAQTPAQVSRLLGADRHDSALGPVLTLRATGTAPPLFCVHPAGGISWCYTGLLPHVGRQHPVYGLQAPGVSGPCDPPVSIAGLAADYLRRIREIQPAGPYHLLGWSMGGVIAYEIAAALRAGGEEVGSLTLLDAYPQIPPELRHDDEAALLLDLLHFINVPDLEPGPGAVDRATVIDVARSHGSAIASLGDGTVDRLIEVFTGNYRLLRDYRPAPLDTDMLLFTATRGRLAEFASADQWRPHTSGEISHHLVDCEHRDMARTGPMSTIGPVLAAHLKSARQSHPSARQPHPSARQPHPSARQPHPGRNQ